jgi:hypothetical protein
MVANIITYTTPYKKVIIPTMVDEVGNAIRVLLSELFETRKQFICHTDPLRGSSSI